MEMPYFGTDCMKHHEKHIEFAQERMRLTKQNPGNWIPRLERILCSRRGVKPHPFFYHWMAFILIFFDLITIE